MKQLFVSENQNLKIDIIEFKSGYIIYIKHQDIALIYDVNELKITRYPNMKDFNSLDTGSKNSIIITDSLCKQIFKKIKMKKEKNDFGHHIYIRSINDRNTQK